MHRKLLRNIGDQLLGVCVTHHEGDDSLAQIGIRQSDDGDFGHPRVAQQCGLDLPGAHPVAAGLDQIHRLAADDAVHAVGVDHCGITGAVPAVRLECVGSRVGPVEVAVEDRRRLHLQASDGLPVVRRG